MSIINILYNLTFLLVFILKMYLFVILTGSRFWHEPITTLLSGHSEILFYDQDWNKQKSRSAASHHQFDAPPSRLSSLCWDWVLLAGTYRARSINNAECFRGNCLATAGASAASGIREKERRLWEFEEQDERDKQGRLDEEKLSLHEYVGWMRRKVSVSVFKSHFKTSRLKSSRKNLNKINTFQHKYEPD